MSTTGNPFPRCGGTNEPACQPTSALKTNPDWHYAVDAGGANWVCKVQGEHTAHNWEPVKKEGFWHKVEDSVGNALGEAFENRGQS